MLVFWPTGWRSLKTTGGGSLGGASGLGWWYCPGRPWYLSPRALNRTTSSTIIPQTTPQATCKTHSPSFHLLYSLHSFAPSCWAAHKPALRCPALPRRRVLYLFAASDSLFETKSPVPRPRLVLISDWHTQLRTQATCHETRALHITSIICTLTWTATGNCLL